MTPSIGISERNCSITVEKGSVMRGNDSDCTKEVLLVMALAPWFMEALKNSKRKTPITTKLAKFGGRLDPCKSPKISPYMRAFMVGLNMIQSIPNRLRWFVAWIRLFAISKAKSLRSQAWRTYTKKGGR